MGNRGRASHSHSLTLFSSDVMFWVETVCEVFDLFLCRFSSGPSKTISAGYLFINSLSQLLCVLLYFMKRKLQNKFRIGCCWFPQVCCVWCVSILVFVVASS